MTKAVSNERLKLLANFVNTTAVTFLSAGVIGPSIAYFYGLALVGANTLLLLAGTAICVSLSAGIHLVGRAILGGIQE